MDQHAETAGDRAEAALRLLRHRDPEVRQEATRRLAQRGDRRAIVALEQMALNDSGTVLVEGAFVDHHDPIAPDAVAALRGLYDRLGVTPADIERMTAVLNHPTDFANGAHPVLALGGDALRPALRAALASTNPRVVIRAARALIDLAETGIDIPRLSRVLISPLSDPDPAVRAAALDLAEPRVWGASWYGWPPDELHDAILARLPREPDRRLRVKLARFIIQYGKSNPADMLAVLRCRNDPERDVRAAVAERLNWFRWRDFGPAVPGLAQEALAWAQIEPDPAIRGSVLWSAPLLPYAPAATDWLIAQLSDPDPKVRKPAAAHLGQAERTRAAEPLLAAADSPDSGVRRAALIALAQIGECRALPKFERELATGVMLTVDREELSKWRNRLKRGGQASRRADR